MLLPYLLGVYLKQLFNFQLSRLAYFMDGFIRIERAELLNINDF